MSESLSEEILSAADRDRIELLLQQWRELQIQTEKNIAFFSNLCVNAARDETDLHDVMEQCVPGISLGIQALLRLGFEKISIQSMRDSVTRTRVEIAYLEGRLGI